MYQTLNKLNKILIFSIKKHLLTVLRFASMLSLISFKAIDKSRNLSNFTFTVVAPRNSQNDKKYTILVDCITDNGFIQKCKISFGIFWQQNFVRLLKSISKNSQNTIEFRWLYCMCDEVLMNIVIPLKIYFLLVKRKWGEMNKRMLVTLFNVLWSLRVLNHVVLKHLHEICVKIHTIKLELKCN